MKDGYKQFFDFFSINDERFIEFGLDNIISPDFEVAELAWSKLKQDLMSNTPVIIRGYGRNASGSILFQEVYKTLFNNHKIAIDKTNNQMPTKLLQNWTKHAKVGSSGKAKVGFTPVQNYQVSHVFGCTKNPLMFTAPWNIIFLPKIMDPFTGHEAKGELVKEFSKRLRSKIFDAYQPLIEDYNSIIQKQVHPKLQDSIQKLPKNLGEEFNIVKFQSDLFSEFDPVLPNTTLLKVS